MKNILITHLLHLHEAAIQNKLVVFVGAGVSANSGVPTWNSLTEAFKDELPDSIKKENDCLKVAQIYKATYGNKAYNEKVQCVLKKGRVAFNPIHKAILQLNPVHIITTNYDDLIEQSILASYKQYDVITQDSELPYYRYPNKVVKMHGDFKTGNIVLTEEDYYNYVNKFPLIRSFVTSLFTTNVVLFVGFSFADLNLKVILNDIKTILDQNMQKVYLLTDEIVDKETLKYYENKGINVVDVDNPDDYISDYGVTIEIEELGKLGTIKGKNLYKQLRIIHEIDKDYSDDLLSVLYKKLKSIQTELTVVGDGLRYFFPKGSYGYWNYYSSGLQLASEYFKSITKKLKSIAGRREFIKKHPKEQRVFLVQQAYVNHIQEIDSLRIITNDNVKKIHDTFDYKHPMDSFYSLDFEGLNSKLKLLEKQGISYNKNDLFLPYLLCRIGRYYDAYKCYKNLLPEFWNKELYILYFICLYNLYHIQHKIRWELIDRSDIDSDSIIREISQFDLNTILLRLPIDNALKNTLKDLVSYTVFSETSNDADELSRQIHRQKKHADKGGASLNSNIYSLVAKFQRTMNFCLSNSIEFNNPYFSNMVKDTIAGILNSHNTPNNKFIEGFNSTKIEALDSIHLFDMLFFINTGELAELFNQYDVLEIEFDNMAVGEIEEKVSNLYQSVFFTGKLINLSFNVEIIVDIIGNIVFIISKAKNEFNINTIEQLYSIIHGLWCINLSRVVEKYLYKLVERYPPSDEMAMDLLEDSIRMDPYMSCDLAYIVKKQLQKSKLVFDRIKDVAILFNNSDGRLGLSLYEVLPHAMQIQFGKYIQQHAGHLIVYLVIISQIRIQIDNVDHFKELINNPKFTPKYKKDQLTATCWYLANMRNQELYTNVYSIIDGFGNKYEQYKFYLNPLEYKNYDKIEAGCFLRLDDYIIKKLLKYETVKSSLSDAVLSDRLDKMNTKRVIKLLVS